MGARAAIWTVALVAIAVACGGEGAEREDRPAAEGTPATGDMLVVALGADADVLLPQTSNSAEAADIQNQLFWYLMEPRPDFIHYDPALADSLRFSDDSLAIAFFINPDARWHDGHPVRAEDVTFGHEVCLAPEINFTSISWLDRITRVEEVDSLTVRFYYEEPYMYQVTDANVCHPLPRHILGDVPMAEIGNHAFTRRPVGSGPFRFVSWNPGEEIVIEAVPDFFRGRPHLNRVSYRVIPEPTSIATQLQNASIDLWPRFQTQFYPQLEQDGDLEIHSYPGRSYTYLVYNTQDPLFSDARVRQALTMAIDRQQIVDALLYDQATVGTQPLISTIWAHDPTIEPWPHDPDRARRLLDEAGWTDSDGDGVREKDGSRLAFDLVTNVNNQLRIDIATIVQEQVRQVGVEARPRTMEFNSYVERLLERDFQAAIGGWVVGIKAELSPYFGAGESFNFPGVENARLDSLLELATSKRFREEARPIWDEAQRIVVDEAYYTFLFQQNDLHAIAERFRGVDMTTYGWDHHLREWYVPEGRQKYDVPVGASPFADEPARPVAAADTAAARSDAGR